jgi:RNA polymerase sigma-70 factor (ECF subfamily)
MKPDVPRDVADIAATVDKDHGRELRAFLARRLNSPNDVADLAQEVYLRLLRLDGSKQVYKPRAFLYGVASHVLADFRLQSAAARQHVSLDCEAGRLEAETVSSIDDASARVNLAQQLQRAFKELPPIQQAVLILLKRDGMSHEEISRKLKISVDMVHKHAVWGKARLRMMKWER